MSLPLDMAGIQNWPGIGNEFVRNDDSSAMNTIGSFHHLTGNEKRPTLIHRRFSIDLVSGSPFGFRDLVALLGPGGSGYAGRSRKRDVSAVA